MATMLGVDIGGSGIKGALVDTAAGQLIGERLRVDTPSSLMPEDVLPAVHSVIEAFEYDGPVGVGFPAVVVDGRPRTPFTAHEIKEWLNFPVAKRLSEMSGCSVTMLNDADAAAVAELEFGAGRGKEGTVILLTLGTGIGSGLFVDGQLVPNTELGKIYLKGRRKVSEQYFSSAARERRGLSWQQWAVEFNEYLDYLTWLFTPQLYIIGGGASKRFDRFAEKLSPATPIVPARLRNQAGIIGAALHAERRYALAAAKKQSFSR